MENYTQKDAAKAAAHLKNHGILAFPTDTVYGVGCLMEDLNDLERLKQIKKRPETKPIPIMVANKEAMEKIAVMNETAHKLADAFLPGAMTLVLPLKHEADKAFVNGLDTAAIRIPDEPFLLEVMAQLDRPLLVSSANISGEPAALKAEEAMQMLPDLDGIVAGNCRNKQASTIVAVDDQGWKILREGPISVQTIETALQS